MNEPLDPSTPPPANKQLCLKVFGVGGAGCNMVAQLADGNFPELTCVAVNTDSQALAHCGIGQKFHLGSRKTRGLGAGGDPMVGRSAAESDLAAIKELCTGVDMVFIMTGLGGGTGTGASPVIARVAKESGALVLAVATLPFDFEGARRQQQAQAGLEQLKAAADAVICLPNQKLCKLHDENTGLVEMFKLTNALLSQGVSGISRLLTQTGLINIDFADLSAVVRGRHAESAFASAEASGPNRAREVVDQLLASTLLDAGQCLTDADAVLVSFLGGFDLSMAEVSRVMERINRQCEHAHVIMGAAIDATWQDRLGVTIVAARRNVARADDLQTGESAAEPEPSTDETQFLSASTGERRMPRFVAPPPAATQENADQLLARQGASVRQRKRATKMRQGQLPLEIVSKGRFEKSEPTIVKGEDLDVPTYIRRGVALN